MNKHNHLGNHLEQLFWARKKIDPSLIYPEPYCLGSLWRKKHTNHFRNPSPGTSSTYPPTTNPTTVPLVTWPMVISRISSSGSSKTRSKFADLSMVFRLVGACWWFAKPDFEWGLMQIVEDPTLPCREGAHWLNVGRPSHTHARFFRVWCPLAFGQISYFQSISILEIWAKDSKNTTI